MILGSPPCGLHFWVLLGASNTNNNTSNNTNKNANNDTNNNTRNWRAGFSVARPPCLPLCGLNNTAGERLALALAVLGVC